MSFSKEEALALLQKAKDEHRLGHAYLVTGSLHHGIEVLAEELAALILGCGVLHLKEHPDFHLIEPESKSRKILTEQMRDLEEALHLKPHQSDYKVAVILDADRMQTAAANAFLKTLEEPPDKTLLILTSNIPEVLLQTIRSRCITIPLYSTKKPHYEESEKKVMQLMEHSFQQGAPCDVTAAFQCTRAFQHLLAEARQAARESSDEEFDAEKKQYGKTIDKAWESRREEHFKAAAEAEALQERAKLMNVIADYFGEKLRSASLKKDEPEFSEEEVIRLLRVLEEVESLRSSLNRGIQEGLALEAGFLKIMQAYA